MNRMYYYNKLSALNPDLVKTGSGRKFIMKEAVILTDLYNTMGEIINEALKHGRKYFF